MSFVIASNMAGGLPLTINFDPPEDGPVTIGFSGTAYTATVDSVIGVDVLLDGNVLGTATLWCNPAFSHSTLPTQFFLADISDGPHTITLRATNANTVTDSNDIYSVWIM